MKKYKIAIFGPLSKNDIPELGSKPELYIIKPTSNNRLELKGEAHTQSLTFATNGRTLKSEIFKCWNEAEINKWKSENQNEIEKAKTNSEEKKNALTQKYKNFQTELNKVKAIFLFPESLTESQYEEIKPLFENLLDETAHEIKNSVTTNSHCFAFYNSIPKKQKNEKIVGLREKLSSRLLALLSSHVYDLENELKREGPLLFSGPSGTGKSLAAQLAADILGMNLVSVNVTGVTEELIEARLRGFAKGSFTGAIEETDGWFGKADGNILFLDEFQNAPEHIQTQLLDLVSANSDRVNLSRLGQENKPNSYQVKLILALNEQIEELIEKKKFRKDLFYRIRRIIDFPSLNEVLKPENNKARKGLDRNTYIQILLKIYQWRHSMLFMGKKTFYPIETLFLEINDEAIHKLGNNSWSGNFREFEMCAAEIIALAQKASQQIVDRPLVELAISQLPSQRLNKDESQQGQLSSIVGLVEQALLRENFVFTKAISHLAAYKIGSTTSLRNFIKEHFSELRPEIQDNSRIKKLIKTKDK